ncbi:MAG TPA: DUF4136 domain-containing protein [Terracidiphilus sp.]|jgi:hypothetical protein
MNTVSKALLAGIAAVLLLSVSGSAQKVETDYDHSANFAQYHTYTWGHVASSDPLFESRIRDAIDHELQEKGWRLAPEGADADVTVTAVAMEKNKREYTTFYDGLGPRWRWHGWGTGMATTSVEDVPVGTLIVDMYDSSSKGLVWRGVARDTLSDKPEKNSEKLEKAVDKMLAKFPPRS